MKINNLFLNKKDVFVKSIFTIFLFLLIHIAFKFYTDWRSKIFLKSLKGDILYSDIGSGQLYRIKANDENNRLLYDNVNFTMDYAQWFEEGKIRFLASTSDPNLPTGNRYVLGVMDQDGGNLEINDFPVQLQGDEISGEKFQKYVESLFNIKKKSEGITIDKGSIYYLGDNGETVKVYDHKFYDSKFNRGPDFAIWSPDKKFIVYDNNDSIVITSIEGLKNAKIPVHGQALDWKY